MLDGLGLNLVEHMKHIVCFLVLTSIRFGLTNFCVDHPGKLSGGEECAGEVWCAPLLPWDVFLAYIEPTLLLPFLRERHKDLHVIPFTDALERFRMTLT
jgi:hypothetical protein